MPPSADDPTLHENAYARDDEIDLIELGAGLWARRWLIGAITLVFTALAALYALLATPSYEAPAELRPQTSSALAELTESDLVSATPQSAFVRTLSELRSSAAQSRAIRRILGDDNSPRLEDIFSIGTSLESRTMSGATTENFTRATIIARHKDPTSAAAMANTLIEIASNATAETLIEELHSTAAARLANLERDIDRRREATKRDTEIRITQLEEKDSIARDELRDRIRELRATSRKLREDELTRLREALSIATELDITEPRGNEFQNIVNIDTSTRTARADRSANNLPLYALGTRWLQAEIAALESREGDDHDTPQIRELEQRLAELEVNEEIEALKRREDFTPFIPGISGLLSEKARLEAAILSEFPNLSVVRIDRVAQPPESPVAPRRKLIVAMGMVLGGMFGVFV
ncbi:MAG: Wzz/FepE/Etk N-terminal domain-containing protein, partial [Pseudomonadales bacterium]